jgi:NDP-sugar pyrophosphorylase family protein
MPVETRKAMILAAGRGTRMRELTDDRPKPMLKVRGKPILEHIVTGLAACGIQEFLIVTGYKAEMIENYFGDGSAFNVSVSYVRQEVQDGTGRVVELGKHFMGEDGFVLSYGDILVDTEAYRRLLKPRPEADAVLTVKYSQDVSKGGAVFFDEETRFLTDLREKPQPGEETSPWYNAGLYLFPPQIFSYTANLEKSPRGEYELTDAIRAMAHGPENVYVLELQGDWADVRDPEVLEQLNSGE